MRKLLRVVANASHDSDPMPGLPLILQPNTDRHRRVRGVRVAEALQKDIGRFLRQIGNCREDIDAREAVRQVVVKGDVLAVHSDADLMVPANESQRFHTLQVVLGGCDVQLR